MRATLALPPSVAILEAALEGLTQANVVLIQAGTVPTSPLDAGVRYQRERSGFEEWNIATRVMKLGWGDCEDLASWQAAGHIADGSDEGARVAILRTGRRTFHAVCALSDGTIEDVCPELGMGRSGHKLPGAKHLGIGADDDNFITSLVKKAQAAPDDIRQQIRNEARAGVTPIVMVAIALSLLALSRTTR